MVCILLIQQNDNKKLNCIYNHHEQACSIAAEGYYRMNNILPAVCVTTGPGGTNAITGVYGAWVDSIPMFVISGQVKRETTICAGAAWTGRGFACIIAEKIAERWKK